MHDNGVTVVIVTGGAGSPARMGGGKTSKKKACPCMIMIPVSALSGSSEGGESMAPEVGDSIQLENVMGRVDSIKGNMAHVEIQSVNGEEAEYMDKEGGDREEMMDMAKKVDEEAGYME